MIRVLTILFLVCFSSLAVIAQVKESGLIHIQKLTAKELAGRGYVQDGMRKSANYIKKELKKAGIAEGVNKYFQYTPPFSVNTFPNALSFQEQLANKEIISYEAGADYLLHPSSGNIRLQETPVIHLKEGIKLSSLQRNSAYYLNKSSFHPDSLARLERFIVNTSEINNSLLIIYDSTKLTWFPSMTSSQNAVLYINKPLSGEKISARWTSKLKEDFVGINVIGKVAGERSDSSIFFTAHYDHLGMLGDHIFPGGNDNASGVAMLLDLAKYYAANKPKYDVFFLFTCGEELGLLGSYFYINSPVYPLKRIKLLVNLDMVGTGDEGITIVNAVKQKRFFDLMTVANHQKIETIKSRGEACNSDHCLFDRAGVPAVFIYTLGGKQAYHDIYDNGEGLSLTAYNGLYSLLIEVIGAY